MSEFPNVQVGQVWADVDPRMAGRTIQIIGIDPENVRGERRALVKVLSDRHTAVKVTVGSTRRLLMRRLKPSKSGYSLVTDV